MLSEYDNELTKIVSFGLDCEVTIACGFCIVCGFQNPKKFKSKKAITEGELFLLDCYLSINKNKKSETRVMMPVKLERFWATACMPCFKSKNGFQKLISDTFKKGELK